MSYETLAKDKKVAIVAVLLVVLAAFFIYRSWQSGQPHTVRKINMAGQGLKTQAMKWQQEHQGQQGAGGSANVPAQSPVGQPGSQQPP